MQFGFINKHLKSNLILNKRKYENVNDLFCFLSIQNNRVYSDVIRSAIGAVVWLVIICTWNIIFQLLRTRMGPTGDYLTFVLPRGYY